MAKIKCPKCKEKMDLAAEICPHCRTAYPPEEVKKRINDQNRGAAIGCLVFVLIIGSCSVMMSGNNSTSSAISKAPGATAKADAITFYKSVMNAIAPCDAAGRRLAKAGSSRDMVSLYQAADEMESACLSTPSEIRKIEVPETVGKKAFDEFAKARDNCDAAYVARWSAAGKMKKALDNIGSVSSQAELRSAAEASQAGVLLCAVGLVGATTSLGVTTEELGIEKSAS